MKGITLYIVSALIVVFIMQQMLPEEMYSFRLVSSEAKEKPWTLLTTIFLHSGVVHLLYNIVGLALFGLIIEKMIGTARLLAVFFSAGLVSSIASALFYDSAIGASGAIFGIIGAVAVLRPLMTVWAYYLPMPMFIAAGAWAIGDLLGLVIPSDVANAAHLSGLAVGIIAGFALREKKPLFEKRKSEKPAVSNNELRDWERKYM